MSAKAFAAPQRAYWEAAWSATEHADARRRYLESCWIFDQVLSRHVPQGEGRDALELGCYPGGFMTYLHRRFGYRVSGIDYVAGAASLGDRLRQEGVEVGTVVQGDVLDVPPDPRFDVVASFGFVEHFDDPMEIVARHAAWLAPGGHAVVTVPRFRGLQRVLHEVLDGRNVEVHNLEAMRVRTLRAAVAAAGLELVHLRPHATFAFWYEDDPARSPARAKVAEAVRRTGRLVQRVEAATHRSWPNLLTSPFLVCIARRPPR